MIDGPWKEGSPLRREVHERMIIDRAYYCRLAGIQEHWLWQPLSQHAGTRELKWIRRLKFHPGAGVQGLLYVGNAAHASVSMQALTGALVRNFIDARIRTLDEVLEKSKSDMPDRDASVLLLPTFCSEAGEVVDWRKQAAWSLLSERDRAGKLTVLFASSLETVKLCYGTAIWEILSSNAFPKVTL